MTVSDVTVYQVQQPHEMHIEEQKPSHTLHIPAQDSRDGIVCTWHARAMFLCASILDTVWQCLTLQRASFSMMRRGRWKIWPKELGQWQRLLAVVLWWSLMYFVDVLLRQLSYHALSSREVTVFCCLVCPRQGDHCNRRWWNFVHLVWQISFVAFGTCRPNWKRQGPLSSRFMNRCNSRRSRRTGSNDLFAFEAWRMLEDIWSQYIIEHTFRKY